MSASGEVGPPAPREVPLVLQDPLSIISVGADTSPIALRAVLEGYNYRPEIHLIGSRKQLLEVPRGSIPSHPLVVLDAHGEGDGSGIVIPEEPKVTPAELAEVVHLPGRVFVSLYCASGSEEFAAAYLGGGCEAYIGPTEEVDANTALLFGIHLCYFLSITHRLPLAEAFARAQAFDEESGVFRLFARRAEGGERGAK